MNTFAARITAVLAGCLVSLGATAADAARRFAAPEVASAPAAPGATGIGQVMLALVVVLAAVFVAALLVKRLRGFTTSGSEAIEVLSQASLGSKERVVIVRVAGSRLLLGVASGSVNLLATLPAEAGNDKPSASPDTGATSLPRFADLLRRSLGR
jgi:flagellar protein FliO/FliZ